MANYFQTGFTALQELAKEEKNKKNKKDDKGHYIGLDNENVCDDKDPECNRRFIEASGDCA